MTCILLARPRRSNVLSQGVEVNSMEHVDDGCGLAPETKVETPEGPMALRAASGKAIPVLTRDRAGKVVFRMMRNARKIADRHQTLQIVLENGAAVRVAPEQLFYRADGSLVPAAALRPGTGLLPAFHYPEGYVYRTDAGDEVRSTRSLAVVRVQPSGESELYAVAVRETGCLFLSAGVLCKAETG